MTKMPAGTYFIGDPCYCFNDSWDKLLKLTNYFQNGEVIDYNGSKLAYGRTAYGDGTYYDGFGHEYRVFAHLLGAVLLEVADNNEDLQRLGRIHQFTEEWIFDAFDGYFKFGKDIEIPTTGYEDDDEEIN